jgi:ubiquinone/menaquinone biosynthesis C-methylase UbiE
MTKMNHFQQKDIVQVWDRVTDTYDFEKYWSNKVHLSWFGNLLSIIGDPIGKSILEVGCGSAFQSLALAERGGVVSLIDISAHTIERASASFIAKGQPAPYCYVCDALNSKIPDNKFDFVWNMGVIEHFPDNGKMQLIREMVRMTKPQGKTIIMVPNMLCWPFQIAQAYGKLRGSWRYGTEDDMSPGRLRYLCRRVNIHKCHTYSFDPISGWYWLPHIGNLLKRAFNSKSVEEYMRKSLFGWMSVLIISKK